MARLNEPPVSTDTIETLRKKFLRQNRDIARINSTQSLRIRALENECGRLLSENLELRSRILQLEKESDDSSAQRIADQALHIKAKMEAQLIEWGAMLAGLGLEPPGKRHSPSGRRIAKSRTSLNRSPARRRLRDLAQDIEALAVQEGRLPPIQENKPYPRQTLNREEILAICSEATDSNDSPDLGPPPVSRFVDEDPIKVDSPSRSTGAPDIVEPTLESIPALHSHDDDTRKLYISRITAEEPEQKGSLDISDSHATENARPSLKAGSKRKFGFNEENDENKVMQPVTERVKPVKDIKPLAVRDLKNRRTVMATTSAPGGAKDKTAATVSTTRPRKPLSVKSTNDDVSSPKKATKDSIIDEVVVAKMAALKKKEAKEAGAKNATRDKKRVVPIQVPGPLINPTIDIAPEPEVLSADPALPCPDTPEARSGSDNPRDTPPPADISAHGETIRPSRRARASVSYAEPNLRDKMRRPTKELVDAVSGEGKYVHRPSTASHVEPSSTTKVKSESDGEFTDLWKSLPPADAAVVRESARRESVLSPLAPKDRSPEELPTTVLTERRKRSSSGMRESMSGRPEVTRQLTKSTTERSILPENSSTTGNDDPYEFTSVSPASGDKQAAMQGPVNSHRARVPRKSSVHQDSGSNNTVPKAQRASKSAISRKRVSMIETKNTSILDLDDQDEDTFESSGEGLRIQSDGKSLAKDKISRRRSMML